MNRILILGVLSTTVGEAAAQMERLNESQPVSIGGQMVTLRSGLRVRGEFLPAGGLRITNDVFIGPCSQMISVNGDQSRKMRLEKGDVVTRINGTMIRTNADYFTAMNASVATAVLTVRDVHSSAESSWKVVPARVAMNAPRPATEPAPAMRATAVKVLLAADTDDASIGRSIQTSLDTLKQRFGQLPGFTEQNLKVIQGTKMRGPEIQSALDSLQVGPTETLVYYHFGHGAYDAALGQGDPSNGHYFALGDGPLMRKMVRDKLVGKGAQLTVLISDTCNVAVPVAPIPHVAAYDFGSNWVLSCLFLEHRGVLDVSGSSKDQFGWYDQDVGGWFSSSCDKYFQPASYPAGTTYVGWDQVLTNSSNLLSEKFRAKKAAFLMDPTIPMSLKDQLNMVDDQRPQIFVNSLTRIQ